MIDLKFEVFNGTDMEGDTCIKGRKRMTVKDALADIGKSIRLGYHQMEAGYPEDNHLNDQQRSLIEAMRDEYGTAWLGIVNRDRNATGHLQKGNGSPIWEWDGRLVYNFGASFVLPQFDAELERLMLEREAASYTGPSADYERIKAIYSRLGAVGGHPLLWN